LPAFLSWLSEYPFWQGELNLGSTRKEYSSRREKTARQRRGFLKCGGEKGRERFFISKQTFTPAGFKKPFER
jgi:hypothetical protein